jgi:hypothetical protein
MALEGVKTYDDEWDEMETPEKKEHEPVPAGRYQAKIDKVYMDVAKNTGADQLCWELVIIAGKFKGKRLYKKNTLLTRENIRWLKDDLEKIELQISPISTLDEHLDEFLDIVVEIYVKNKAYQGKDYATPYINKRLDIEIPPDLNSDKDAGTGEVDDCPF